MARSWQPGSDLGWSSVLFFWTSRGWAQGCLGCERVLAICPCLCFALNLMSHPFVPSFKIIHYALESIKLCSKLFEFIQERCVDSIHGNWQTTTQYVHKLTLKDSKMAQSKCAKQCKTMCHQLHTWPLLVLK